MNVIAIIINIKAKNAANAKLYLEEFNKLKIPYHLYETEPKNLSSIIKDCISKYQLILIGGGDGTIRTAAQYCAKTSMILGVLPLGTMNHFSKELNLPQNVNDMVHAIKSQKTIAIDLAEVNGHVFLNNSSIGFYPKFADTRDDFSRFYNKWLSYIPGFIASLKKHDVFEMTIKSKNFNCFLKTSFLMISNNIYSFEFPLTFKRDNFQKSLLGLYYFKHGKIQLFKILKSIFNNKRNFVIKKLKHPLELHFKKQKEMNISLDGETLKVKTPLKYKSVAQSLTILMNPS